MTNEQIWNDERPIEYIPEFSLEIPGWIGAHITPCDIIAITEGGCASGAWMDAVTYHTANSTMDIHGDDVLEFIEEHAGELPPMPDSISWSGLAAHYLSCAVELWACMAMDELENCEPEEQTA